MKNWALENRNVEFVVEDSPLKEPILDPYILYRWTEGLSYEQWVDDWAKTDYLVCDENDKSYWLQAALCGVSVVFSDSELEDLLNNGIKPITSVERVDNWEKAKNLLT